MNVESEATYEGGVLRPDKPLPLGDKQRVHVTVHASDADGEGVGVRRELASSLLASLDQLALLVGDVALATEIQPLKRGLARCHDELKGRPSEGPYLSIVTLVESALTQLTWKQYTPEILATIRKVLATGSRKSRLTFADYDRARRLMADRHIDANPRIDLAALTPEDLVDDEADLI